MTVEQDKAFIRYGMARFGAYANVMPVLANEVEQKYTKNSIKSTKYDLRSQKWCNEIGGYLAEQAVFGLPVSVHNPMFMGENISCVKPSFYTLIEDWPFPWADCIMKQVQIGSYGGASELWDDFQGYLKPEYNNRAYARHNDILVRLRRYNIPVINEEPGYEMAGYDQNDWLGGDNGYSGGSYNSMNPNHVLNTFWTAFTAGAYCMWGHFDTYEMEDPYRGIKRTNTPKYLKILHDFAITLKYWEMEPMNEAVSASEEIIEGKPYRTNFCLAKKGETYIVYSINGGRMEISLESGVQYKFEQINPRTGNRLDLGIVSEGKQTFNINGKEQVLFFSKI
jgi:hypothetical protein